MKTNCFVFALVLATASNLAAQKGNILTRRPTWAAGMYGSISFGYGAFSQPFKNSGTVTPYPSFAATGKVFHWDGGIVFRNRWGLRAAASGYASNNLTVEFLRTLEAMYPTYVVDYAPTTEIGNKNVNHFALGISYAFPRDQWYFQSEILLGSTEVYSDLVAVQAKELGTHRTVILQMRPKNYEYRSPTLTLGGRASWYAGRYFGFFADARLTTMWYDMQYLVDKTLLIEQTLEKETIRLKKTAFGATASVGLFLQIARWEE